MPSQLPIEYDPTANPDDFQFNTGGGTSGGGNDDSTSGGTSTGTGVVIGLSVNPQRFEITDGVVNIGTTMLSTPVVDFSYTQLDGTQIKFIDKTLNDPGAHLWNFGDGSVSTTWEPIHKFPTAGTYSVTLTCWSKDGMRQSYKTAVVTVTNAARAVDFTYTYSGKVVQFTLTTTINNAVLWDLGDGNYSTSTSPAHTYAAAGSYAVTVTLATGESATHVVTVDKGIQLNWQDNSSDETGFRIYHSTGGAYTLLATVGAGVTSYLVTENVDGIDLTVTNYFKVLAYNAAGDSGYSNVANAGCV